MGFRLGGSKSSEFPVRLATYNVYFGKLSRPALLDEIAAMHADIILLQATYDSMFARVKERFPDRQLHHTDDFILITRYKIRRVEEPPPLSDGTLPKFIGYVLETDAGPLRVFNVHPFSPRHALFEDEQTNDNIRHREEQVAAVVAAAQRPGPPFVIAGDTNLPALSSMGRRYFADLHDAFDDVGFGLGYTSLRSARGCASTARSRRTASASSTSASASWVRRTIARCSSTSTSNRTAEARRARDVSVPHGRAGRATPSAVLGPSGSRIVANPAGSLARTTFRFLIVGPRAAIRLVAPADSVLDCRQAGEIVRADHDQEPKRRKLAGGANVLGQRHQRPNRWMPARRPAGRRAPTPRPTARARRAPTARRGPSR